MFNGYTMDYCVEHVREHGVCEYPMMLKKMAIYTHSYFMPG